MGEPGAGPAARDRATTAYNGSFTVVADTIPPGLRCETCHRLVLASRVPVDQLWRFDDELGEQVLLAVRCPRCGAAGTVMAGGPAARSGHAREVLDTLQARAATRGVDRPRSASG